MPGGPSRSSTSQMAGWRHAKPRHDDLHRTPVGTRLTSASRATPRWRLRPPALPMTAEPLGVQAAPALGTKIGQTPAAAISGSTATVPGEPGEPGESGDPRFPGVPDLRAKPVPDIGSTLRRQGRHWLVKLNVVRDAVMDLPPMPLTVWAGGVVGLLLIGARRISRSLAIVRAGRPAGASVERIVAAASRQLGLGCPPATRMIDEPISPMLICGRHVWLILPAALWAELDDAGRGRTQARLAQIGFRGGSCAGPRPHCRRLDARAAPRSTRSRSESAKRLEQIQTRRRRPPRNQCRRGPSGTRGRRRDDRLINTTCQRNSTGSITRSTGKSAPAFNCSSK